MRLPEIFKTMTLAFYQDAGLDGMTDADLIDFAVEQVMFEPEADKDELRSFLDSLLAAPAEVREEVWWASPADVIMSDPERLKSVLREIRARL